METQVQHLVKKNHWLAALSVILFIIGIYTIFIGIGILLIALAIYLGNRSNVMKMRLGNSIIPGIFVSLFGIFMFVVLGESFGAGLVIKLGGLMISISGLLLSISIYLKKRKYN